MQVVAKPEAAPDKIVRVQIVHGSLIRTVESREHISYTIRNEDTATRTLILEHPVRSGWILGAGAIPDEQSASAYRFRIEVPSKQTKVFTVEETTPVVATYDLTRLDSDDVETFVKQRALTPEMEIALRQILAQQEAVSKLDDQITSNKSATDRIVKDQERLRENMKALKGTPEEKALTQRYTNELNDQETQLDVLRKQLTELQDKRDKASDEVDATIERMAFDTAPK
jgi:hypothetical protein